MLRDRLKIKSLMWYPLAFHAKGFYMLILNDIHACRVWTKVETDFLDSVSHQVSLALEKIRLVRESQRAEKNLRIAATAFESQECMLILDADCNILRSNQAFTTIAGYAAKDVKGKSVAMLRTPNHDQAFYAAMWKYIDEVGGWEGETWSMRKNGESYPINLSITAVKDHNEAIINYVATFTDITENKAAEKEIEHLAFYDALTQLPNRRLLQDRLRQVIALSGRVDHQGALLFIDMDNFKNLNDTLGHDMGDLLLKQVAQRLLVCVRESDTVSRLGGDEFVILLTNLSHLPMEAAEETKNISEKILETLNQRYQLDAHEYHISPSIGVTLFGGNHASIDELMKQADIAMYQAKKSGRNAIFLFDPAMQSAMNARVEMEKELHHALEDGQFALYYQLQVDGAHRPVGVEALIRWIHPQRGMVSPLDFIPLAEESGLIVPIGRWVIETACAQLKQWSLNDRTCQLTIAVNVSAKQFRQLGFVESIRTAVQQAGIKPHLLKLELTESLLLDNIADTIVTMNALKAIGVIFSLDDFGTGYSSLQYLKQLPIDQLKIDQSFVRDIAIDLSDQAIVSTIIAMAKSLKLNVIAEGVETMEQQRFLFSHGCFHYQGYLFGKPMPIEEFIFEAE
jgi:diguanylate cyclase (GGDEF)-like protein/PAS domain S-box-containing protein